VAVLVGDILALWAGDRPSETMPLAAPPTEVAVLNRTALHALTGESVQISDIAYGPDGLTLVTSRGLLSLDTLGRITSRTARDLHRARGAAAPTTLQVQAPLTGLRLQLLTDQQTVRVEDPETDAEQTVVVDGGPFSGLVAIPWGGFALWRQVPGVPAAVVARARLRGARIAVYPQRLEPALVTAAAADAEGNLWLYDAVDRRIRILDESGREIHAIRPQVDRAAFALPQGLAVYPDGSFLLAGAGEIWKLDPAGLPVWRLTRLSGGRALPPSLRIALHGARGSFSLLDPESGEIHLFAERVPEAGATDATATLARYLRDGPTPQLAEWCLDNGLTLLAGQYLAVQHPGETVMPEARAAALLRRRQERQLAEDLALQTARWAERRAAALDLAGAEPYYTDAIERYRVLRDAYPSEIGYAQTREALTAARLGLRETLLGFLDLDLVVGLKDLLPWQTGAEAHALDLTLTRAPGGGVVEGVVVEIGASAAVLPATLPTGDLVAGRLVRVPLVLDGDAALGQEDRSVTLGVRLSGTIDREVFGRVAQVRTTLAARDRHTDGDGPLAVHLAWFAGARDPALSAYTRDLLDNLDGNTPAGSVDAVALVYQHLAATLRREPGEIDTLRSPRQILASHSGSETDALLLAAAMLEGTERAFLEVDGEVYLLLDTGLDLPPSTAAAGQKTGVHATLARIAAAAGTHHLLLPLGPPVAATDSRPLAESATAALRRIDAAPDAPLDVAWVRAGATARAFYHAVAALPRGDLLARAEADATATRRLVGPGAAPR
jgi:hypothetical protein